MDPTAVTETASKAAEQIVDKALEQGGAFAGIFLLAFGILIVFAFFVWRGQRQDIEKAQKANETLQNKHDEKMKQMMEAHDAEVSGLRSELAQAKAQHLSDVKVYAEKLPSVIDKASSISEIQREFISLYEREKRGGRS